MSTPPLQRSPTEVTGCPYPARSEEERNVTDLPRQEKAN